MLQNHQEWGCFPLIAVLGGAMVTGCYLEYDKLFKPHVDLFLTQLCRECFYEMEITISGKKCRSFIWSGFFFVEEKFRHFLPIEISNSNWLPSLA